MKCGNWLFTRDFRTFQIVWWRGAICWKLWMGRRHRVRLYGEAVEHTISRPPSCQFLAVSSDDSTMFSRICKYAPCSRR